MFVMYECKIDNKRPQRHTFILNMLYSISSAAPNTFLYFISFKAPDFSGNGSNSYFACSILSAVNVQNPAGVLFTDQFVVQQSLRVNMVPHLESDA